MCLSEELELVEKWISFNGKILIFFSGNSNTKVCMKNQNIQFGKVAVMPHRSCRSGSS